MTTETAEDAMRRACDSIMRGDIMTALADLTPEAFQEAMVIGANIVSLPTPESYEFTSREQLPDGTHRFVVRFKTSAQGIIARASWKQLDGYWKITSISADGLQPG